MSPIDPAQAVDLSSLGQPAAAPSLPPGSYQCQLCGLVIRGTVKHETLEDCLQTVLPYVDMFLELRENTEKLVVGLQRMERTNVALLDANERLSRENDKLKGDLRAARKGTPEAAKSVLEGAEELSASMKASVQPVQKVEVTAAEAREYLKGMGVPPAIVDATPDDGLSELYEQYAGSS